MGSIYKRGQTYWVQYYRNGKPYRESTRGNREADAKRLLKLREVELAKGKLPGVQFDKVQFNDLKDDYLRDYRVNQRKSLRKANECVRHLEYFTSYKVPQINTPLIQKYIEKRISEGAANATINRELSALKRMLNMGARQTPPKVDRVPYIAMLKENNTRKGFFEHGDFIALIQALPTHLKGFTTFGYKTGWRIAEISNLKWAHVDLKQGIVKLDPGESKNTEGRTVYLDEELKEVFAQLWEDRKISQVLLPCVFPNKERTGSVMRFDKAWKRACIGAGIGIKLFHDLRRTAVRNMVRAGISEKVAMMVSGHKTRAIFYRYNIVNESDLKLAMERH